MIEALFTIFACAVLMRIKGGGVIKVDHTKLSSACGFSVLVFGLTGNPLLATLGAVAWFIGCAPAVKQTLLNLGGYRGSFRFEGWGEYKIITMPIDFIVDRTRLKNLPLPKLRQFYGVAGVTIRGMAMAIPMAIVFQSLPMLLIGHAMALCYFAGMSVLQYARANGVKRSVYDDYFDGWSLGEWFWGAAIGLLLHAAT